MKEVLAGVMRGLNMEAGMFYPVLTEAFNGQRVAFTTETLISTMLLTWLKSKEKGEARVAEVKKALQNKGLMFTGPSTWEGGIHQRL